MNYVDFEKKNVLVSSVGILSRTLGSISSIGSMSFTNSPNFSTLVDFSSGLFTDKKDDRGRVKDLSEVIFICWLVVFFLNL